MNELRVFSVALGLMSWLFLNLRTASAQEQEEAWCTVGESATACIIGRCDDPDHRNAFLPELMPETTIRLRFNVFCEDANNQFTCAATEEEVAAQFERLRQDFDAFDIDFVRDQAFHSDVQFRDFCPSGQDCFCDQSDGCRTVCTGKVEGDMKSQYAVSPQSQLNVYVINMHPNTNTHGKSAFPWCSEATGTFGAVMIDDDSFGGVQCGPAGDQPCQTLTHEVAHALGLWHTFQAREPCRANCLEPVECDGTCSDPTVDCDRLGDLTCDTAAVPELEDCASPPAGGDFCTPGSPPWPVNQPDTNYMNLGPDGCWNHFTVRQGGRMHCWSCDRLAGWMQGVTTGACCPSEGSCFLTTEDCCANAGDLYAGDGTACDGTCCLPDGSCRFGWSSACCTDAGGTFGGVGTDCSVGACCFADGSCQNEVTDAGCLDAGGVFAGPNSDCTTGPFGRCCMPDGPCLNDTIEPCCYAVGGWLWEQGKDCCTQPFCPQLAGPLVLQPCL